MIDQGVGWCFGPLSGIVLAAVDKSMRIHEKRLFGIRVVMLRVCRHGAQVAAEGQTGIRVFLDPAHPTAGKNPVLENAKSSIHWPTKMVKNLLRTACARA